MKHVTAFKKYPAQRKVKPIPKLRQRNPAIRSFAGSSNSAGKQVLTEDDGLGGFWDDITKAVSTTSAKLYDQAIASGQKAATTYVQKQLVRIIGSDGQPKEVVAGSPEARQYQTQNAASSSDPMMKYMMYAMMGVGGLLVVGLAFKLLKK